MRSTGCKDRTGTVNNQTEYGHFQTVSVASKIAGKRTFHVADCYR
jgi:hypothetical protein